MAVYKGESRGKMMDCKQIQQCTDDFLDGTLPAGELHLVNEHLAGCDACRTDLSQLQALRQALRALPVPPPSADFRDRVLASARQAKRPRRLPAALATAIAASLMMWIGVTLYQPGEQVAGIEAIALNVSDTRKVRLVFNAPENFHQVTLKLELSNNIELAGYSGKRDLEWQATLKKGSNTLVLPITATGHGKAEVVAHIKHAGKTRTFRIPVSINPSGARLDQTSTPLTV